jgi:hypothetical protein
MTEDRFSYRLFMSAGVVSLLGILTGTVSAANNYLVHNLVSDLPGIADHKDQNLVNAWGLDLCRPRREITGLGATNPAVPNGQTFPAPLPLSVTPTVTIGGLNAQVAFAGLISPGLYQVNVVIPSGIGSARRAGNVDAAVSLQAGAAKSQGNAVISVAAPPQ